MSEEKGPNIAEAVELLQAAHFNCKNIALGIIPAELVQMQIKCAVESLGEEVYEG